MHMRTLNGRYRLDELIGEGGMAVVYRGYDLVLNRVVAVKILRDQYGADTSFLRRFEREAQSAARLSHPHIASVYDVGQDRDTRYIVMEYVHGPNLKDLIRRQGPFSVDGAAFVIRQMAAALDYAHERGLVHRDIKPQNILVDQNGNVKVVDFGIAKGLSDASLTEAGTGMGTVHYVSPEQARGEAATSASDIYATGVVLYEMLTKRLPFEADTPVGVAMQHVSVDPPPPTDFNPAIPFEVEDVVLQALAKEPEDRFATAGDLADALDTWDHAPSSGHGQATRVMAATGGNSVPSATRRRPPATAGRGGPPARRVRDEVFRDDIGCVTWLIGSAILIGLVGLVILGFKIGDLSLFAPPASKATQTPTATEQVLASPTTAPSPTATISATPSASPTALASPSPTASPTPVMARVPYLMGSTLDQATQAVKVGNFTLVTKDVFSDTYPRGYVVSQDPAPETELAEGSPVTVTVSQGPEFITLPNLANQPQTQAQQELQNLGLKVAVVEEGSQTVPQGNVIRTDPSAQIRNGGTVTMYVSVGDKIQVPDVFRQPYQQAEATLQQAGLTVGAVSPQSCTYIKSQDATFNCRTFPNGGVVSGTLQWKSWVPRGSTIVIAYYDASAQ